MVTVKLLQHHPTLAVRVSPPDIGCFRYDCFVAYVQPFGWGSREFLRKLVLGQQVTFKVDYRVESISRDFGTITLNGESVSRAVVREGWARVKTGGQNREGETSPEYDELVKLEAEAQGAKRGMHSDDRAGAVRDAKVSNETCITRFLVLKAPQAVLLERLRVRLEGIPNFRMLRLADCRRPIFSMYKVGEVYLMPRPMGSFRGVHTILTSGFLLDSAVER